MLFIHVSVPTDTGEIKTRPAVKITGDPVVSPRCRSDCFPYTRPLLVALCGGSAKFSARQTVVFFLVSGLKRLPFVGHAVCKTASVAVMSIVGRGGLTGSGRN